MDLHYKSNDWFLYDMQHWAEMSWPISGTTVLKWNLDSKCLNNLSFLLHDYFSFYAQVVKVDLDGLVTVLWSDESTSSILPSRLYVLDKEAS